MRPYEYLVWLEEKVNADEEVVEKAQILVEPQMVMARDEKTVAMIATRALSDEQMDKVERIHIEVRPFFA